MPIPVIDFARAGRPQDPEADALWHNAAGIATRVDQSRAASDCVLPSLPRLCARRNVQDACNVAARKRFKNCREARDKSDQVTGAFTPKEREFNLLRTDYDELLAARNPDVPSF